MKDHILVRLQNRLPISLLKFLINRWRPLRGMGIKVIHLSKDFTTAKVRLDLKWYNKNHLGIHFGGSMFSMVDPFTALLYATQLGASKHIVVMKKAEVEFFKPGRRTLYANFVVTADEVEYVRKQLKLQENVVIEKVTDVTDESGQIITVVRQNIYIAKRR
jgi:acyl-coenzyme A thioesterase PaaI-like protein